MDADPVLRQVVSNAGALRGLFGVLQCDAPPPLSRDAHRMRIANRQIVILFFFQAEDGIRDRDVTGVQTCALPISTASAVAYARDAERIGVDGLMVLPAMVYVPTRAELEYHLRAVAQATSLPIMLYNNPPAYRVNIEIETLERLAELRNIVAIKESAPDPRRFTDLLNAH